MKKQPQAEEEVDLIKSAYEHSANHPNRPPQPEAQKNTCPGGSPYSIKGGEGGKRKSEMDSLRHLGYRAKGVFLPLLGEGAPFFCFFFWACKKRK